MADDDSDTHHRLVQDILETRAITIKRQDGEFFISSEGVIEQEAGPLRCTCGKPFPHPKNALEHVTDL